LFPKKKPVVTTTTIDAEPISDRINTIQKMRIKGDLTDLEIRIQLLQDEAEISVLSK
jgi:hypothetical protein